MSGCKVRPSMQRRESTFEGGGVHQTSPNVSTAEKLAMLPRSLPSLYRYAYRLLGNRADAEDAVQDALLAALTHLSQFRGDAQLSTWLTAIVINSVRMHLRKRLRHPHISMDSQIGEEYEPPLADTLADERPSPEDECHRSMLHRRLMKSAAQLSPILRKTFHLRFTDHLSIRETARLLGVPTGTVKAQSARARAKLLKAMRARPTRIQRNEYSSRLSRPRQSKTIAQRISAVSDQRKSR